MSRALLMAEQHQSWIENLMNNPGLSALALAGLTGVGKLIFDFWKVVIDGYRNKSKAQLDKEIQENTSRLDGQGLAIKILQEGLSDANARASLALKQNIECEAKHELLIEKYNDIILSFAMKGEKLEKSAGKLEQRTQELEQKGDIAKVVADALADKLTNVKNSEILKNLKEID